MGNNGATAKKTRLNKKGIEEGRGFPLPFPPLSVPCLVYPDLIFPFYSIKEAGPMLLFFLQCKQRNKIGMIKD